MDEQTAVSDKYDPYVAVEKQMDEFFREQYLRGSPLVRLGITETEKSLRVAAEGVDDSVPEAYCTAIVKAAESINVEYTQEQFTSLPGASMEIREGPSVSSKELVEKYVNLELSPELQVKSRVFAWRNLNGAHFAEGLTEVTLSGYKVSCSFDNNSSTVTSDFKTGADLVAAMKKEGHGMKVFHAQNFEDPSSQAYGVIVSIITKKRTFED